jgi:hypothetical protein
MKRSRGVPQHLDNLLLVAVVLLNDLISDSRGTQVGVLDRNGGVQIAEDFSEDGVLGEGKGLVAADDQLD